MVALGGRPQSSAAPFPLLSVCCGACKDHFLALVTKLSRWLPRHFSALVPLQLVVGGPNGSKEEREARDPSA